MSRTDDIVAIGQLQAHYADVVNRRAWPELAELFQAEATVRIDTVDRDAFEVTGPTELGDFIGGAVERFAFFEFVILNSRIQLGPDIGADDTSAAARIFMCEIRRATDSLDWSVAYGVYHDRYARTDGLWRFARRDYQSLTRTDGGVFPFPGHLEDLGQR